MKKNIRFLLVFTLLTTIFWSCSKDSGLMDSSSLKLVINQNAMNLNNTVGKITSTQAFSILTVSDGTLKSETITDSSYRVYIGLDKIKGVYEYKPVNSWDRWGFSLIRYFKRTADNSQMIVKMPLKKVKNPMSLRHYSHADSTLSNNFQIAVSDYYNNYNSYWDYEYLLDSKISIDDKEAGSLYMKSLVSPLKGRHYTSQYAFAGGYTAKYKFDSGDTTSYSFSIMDGTKTLYGEQRIAIKNDTAKHHREHQYILTIGNVQIIRKPASHSVQIAVNGIVQPNAVVTVIDTDEQEGNNNDGDHEGNQEASCTDKRDIQITFEDGTTATISELIGNSVSDIRTIFKSLHQVYFAATIVDWIAYDIYYHRN
jgi:hypothetical protein